MTYVVPIGKKKGAGIFFMMKKFEGEKNTTFLFFDLYFRTDSCIDIYT